MTIEKNTPSDEITKSSLDNKVVVDSKGRTFTLQNPDYMKNYDLIKVMDEDSKNDRLFSLAFHLVYIKKIDNAPFLFPINYVEYKAALQRVGSEGRIAILQALSEESEILGDSEARTETIKK